MNDLVTWLRPATHVHVGMMLNLHLLPPWITLSVLEDQSPAAVLKRIQLQLPEEAEQLLQGRVRIIKCANLAWLVGLHHFCYIPSS